jgi:hypothetical protein
VLGIDRDRQQARRRAFRKKLLELLHACREPRAGGRAAGEDEVDDDRPAGKGGAIERRTAAIDQRELGKLREDGQRLGSATGVRNESQQSQR